MKIDIEGADGAIDLTDFFGEPKYEDCTHKFQFSSIVPQSEFLTQYSTIKNAIHGKKLGIILDDDPSFFYIGRCHVSSFTSAKGVGTIAVECDCEPWKYKAAKTVVTQAVNSGTIEGYLNLLIDSHNAQVDESKWFTVGNVTVTDANDYIVRSNIDYVNTWDEMEKKLIDLLGGYIVIRHEGYINYLDYLQDFTLLSPQKITFGKNLLDLKRIRKGADIATALIPLGAKLKDDAGNDTDERLTIAAVNDGLDYIVDTAAVDKYGFICAVQTWDDVTEASNLLTKGKAHLAGLVNQPETIELTAADLATVDASFSSFHLGTYVKVESNPHGISQNLLVSKLFLKLLEPAANKLTLGGVFEGISGALAGVSNAQGEIILQIENASKTASTAIYNVEQNLLASLQVSEENIKSTVSENYYLKDQTDALVSSVSTEIEQTKNSVEIQFNQFSVDIEAVAAGADAEFEEIKKYIRFVDGKILLGQVGNELELQIANDRINFLQDGAEVAYFTNRKLYDRNHGDYTSRYGEGHSRFRQR